MRFHPEIKRVDEASVQFYAIAENQRQKQKENILAKTNTARDAGLADTTPHAVHVDEEHHNIEETLQERRESMPEPIKHALEEEELERHQDSYLSDRLIQLSLQLQREARISAS